MKFLPALLLCTGLAAPACASAGVIYEWRTYSNSSSIYAVDGFIELSQAAVQAGHLAYQFQDPCFGDPLCSYADPNSALLRFRLQVNGHPLDIDIANGSGFLFGPSYGALMASFEIGAWRLGPVNIYANSGESHVLLDGYTIVDANSDMLGCPPDGCNGATGGFFRVPEPGTLALFLTGMLVLRRRRLQQ